MQNSHPQLYFLFNLLSTWFNTVESLPPLVPIAIFSPGLNNSYFTMVSCTSASKQTKKHSWQMGCCVFGRFIIAFAFLQTSHRDLDIVVAYISFIELQTHGLTNNFKMSQIKSYLSIDSVPSQEFRTPVKHTIQHMSTNNSLSFSNTMGSLDNKSSWNKRTLYRSNELDKDIGFQTRDFVEQQEEYMENNSSVTLNPVITQADLYEFVNSVKIVAFLSKDCEDKKAIIANKQKVIKKLQTQIFLIEQRAKFQKRQFQKKEKAVKSRSLSMQKYKKQVNERIHNNIIDMKLQIGKMRRTLSSQKAGLDTRRVISTNQKRRSMPMDSNRSDRKIYVPIYSNRAYYYPHDQIHQRHSSRSDYNPMAPPNSMRNNPIQLDSSLCNLLKKENSIENNVFNSVKNTPNAMFPPTPPRSQEMPGTGRDIKIFELLQQKLQTQPNLLTGINQPFSSFEVQQNQQICPPQTSQIPRLTLNQQSIRLSKNNLDYFNDDFGDQNLKEQLMTSQKSKKSIKNLKQSSRSMTNKWKKDNEDQEIVELLKESIDLAEKKQSQKSQKSQKKQEKRSDIGAKLVVTTTMNQQNSLQTGHLGVPAPNNRQASINNGSQVDIFIQNSEQKKANDSRDSGKRLSAKNNERAIIANSEIGIILQDINDSIDDLPLSIQSKMQSPTRKNGCNLYKEVPKIQEVQDEFPKTPVDFKIMNNLQPSFESRYTITPREIQAVPMVNSHGSNLSKEEQSFNTPPLSRPPSLIEQDEEGDIIDSIKLTGNSRHFQDSPASKISKIVHDPVQEEEQDFLGGIRLVAMSRISRQKNSQSSLKDSDLLEHTSNQKKMTHSDLAPQIQPMNDDANGMDTIDSQLRKSTNSVIIKKGNSAIQRSVNRKQQSPMKQSNRGSTLSGKSNELSTPIEEADEQQEEVSHIVKRHHRNLTDVPS